MTKKPFWHGYEDAQDYFTNAIYYKSTIHA
jgi:hypothetical protein